MPDEDESETTTVLLDLRDVKSWVEARSTDGEREFILVISDGVSRVEFTGGLSGHGEASIYGAQRIAAAALDYASGIALLILPEKTS
jgi:hypothetical protein